MVSFVIEVSNLRLNEKVLHFFIHFGFKTGNVLCVII